MDTAVKEALTENTYIEVQDWLLTLDREVVDADMTEVPATLMIDLPKAAMTFVTTYGGNVRFVHDLKRQAVRKGTLTVPQLRQALNVLRQEMRAGRIVVARKDGRAEPIKLVTPTAATTVEPDSSELVEGQDNPSETHRHQCYTCRKWFPSYGHVMTHKTVVHYRGSASVPVLKEEEVEETLLDLSALPDGRYAAEDPKDPDQWLFFSVKTLRKKSYLDRKYRYGKFRIGNEWTPAGTIEVRLWSQDSKKLVGQQKPGHGYRGEFVDQMVEIMESPRYAAKIFCKSIGACSICGKTLTDNDSKDQGIGPECFKKWGTSYWKNWSRERHLDKLVESGILPKEEREAIRAADEAKRAAGIK